MESENSENSKNSKNSKNSENSECSENSKQRPAMACPSRNDSGDAPDGTPPPGLFRLSASAYLAMK